MGLLSGDCQDGGGGHGHGEQPVSPGCVAEEESFSPLKVGQEKEDEGAEEDCEEYVDFSLLPDTRSIASDDSFYPADQEDGWLEQDEPESWGSSEAEDDAELGAVPEAVSLFRAASTNNVGLLRALISKGPRAEEVLETDRNSRHSQKFESSTSKLLEFYMTGLIVACYQGFVDVVVALAECPHIDVNWQDNEGNTALITAAQAGADVHATDPSKRMTAQEWASYTGRFEAVCVIQRLLDRPCPQQFSEQYKLDWPIGKDVLVKPAEPKSCLQRLNECFRSILSSRYVQGPEDGGVLDHMVRMTTSLHSPAVAIACKTVCPESPPCIGKRRLAVQEILQHQNIGEVHSHERGSTPEKLSQNSPVEEAPPKTDRRGSLQPSPSTAPRGGSVAPRKASLLPLHLLRRSSVRPGFVIPKVRINKAPTPTFQPERVKKKSGVKDNTHLQIPKWRYKEAKEERRKAEQAEKKKTTEGVPKERRVSPWRNRT
ncbi:ankyrin repeat domain-containing protein 33B isoform 3-T3 [Sarcophilus harrisii]